MTLIDNQAAIAKQHSIEFPGKPVWLYQYGPGSFGIRFEELPNTEPGLLVGIFYRGRAINRGRAIQIALKSN